MPFRPTWRRCGRGEGLAGTRYAPIYAFLALILGLGGALATPARAQEDGVAVADEGVGYDAGAEGRTAFDEAVSRIRGEIRFDGRWEYVTSSNEQGTNQNNQAAAFTVSPSRHKRDVDLFAYLSLYAQGLGHKALDIKFSSRFEWDLAGDPDRYEFSDYRDDRHSSRAHFALRELYARIRLVGPKDALVQSGVGGGEVAITGGRFYFHELGQYYNLIWGGVDGGKLEFDHIFGHFSGQVFGGVRASQYNSRRYKSIVGGHVTFHTLEDRLNFTISDVLHLNNVLTGTIDAAVSENILVGAQVNFIDNDLDQLRTWVDVDVPAAYFNVFLFYRSVFDNSDKFDYDYTDSDLRDSTGLGQRYSRRRLQFRQEPGLDDYEVRMYKGFGVGDGVFGIYAQGRRREIRTDAKRDQYNFDFWEGTFGFDIHDLPFDGFFFEAKLNYVDPDHPAFGSNSGNFDDIRGEGETYWIEAYTHARISFFYYRVTIGAEYWYREMEYRTRFVRLEDIRQSGYGAYILAKITENLRVRVDYFYEGAFDIVDQDIGNHQRLMASIRFSF